MKVIVKAKELAIHSFKLTSNNNRYPKKYRHSLADRIQLKALDIYDTLLEANRINNAAFPAMRRETISRAVLYCDQMLFYIELSMGLTDQSMESIQYWSKMVTDVKYLSLAWRKKETK